MSATPSRPLASLDPLASARDQVLVAYRGMWASFVEASRTSDDQYPTLSKHATDDALAIMVKGLRSSKKRGYIAKGEPTFEPKITSLTPAAKPARAQVTDCSDSTRWLEYKKTGELADSKPGGWHRITAKLRKISGKWLVTWFRVREPGTC